MLILATDLMYLVSYIVHVFANAYISVPLILEGGWKHTQPQTIVKQENCFDSIW